MNQDVWVWIAMFAILLVVIFCLRGMSKLHKGINRIFCPIPQSEEKMMQKFCKAMTKIAEERETKITESNFEVIKALYNTTEKNKLMKLTDILFGKYSWQIILAIGVFMVELVADDEKEYFLQLFMLIKPWVLAVFILILAFIKMLNDREFISEEEIYRKNVTYVMWKEYTAVHKIDICERVSEKQKDNNWIKRFWNIEKWTLLSLLFGFCIVILVIMTYIPQTNNFTFAICSLLCAIVVTFIVAVWQYTREASKGWNLWEEVKLLYRDTDELQCFETIKKEISLYNNEEKDREITKRNLQVLEAAMEKDKAVIILMPIVLNVFSWFLAGKDLSLDALLAGSIDTIMGLILLLVSCLALINTLVEYPKHVFIEKVVEKMKDEIDLWETKAN